MLRSIPPIGTDGVGAWYSALSAGKESVCLNLKAQAHREAMYALLEQADVLVESFRPGVLARIGLDPEQLRARFPRLVICSITGFGQSGPLRDEPGHDLGFQALAGLLSLGKHRDGVMDLPGLQVADVGGGALTAALRIVAALLERERTGSGCWLDVSMTEGTLAMVAPQFAAAATAGIDPVAGGDVLTGGAAQYQVYACADGRAIAVAALEPKFWSALEGAVGHPVSRSFDALSTLFKQESAAHWAERLRGTCCEPVLTLSEVADHPAHVARGSIAGRGERARVAHPFEGGADTASRRVPGLGEHTDSVLREVGFDVTTLGQEES